MQSEFLPTLQSSSSPDAERSKIELVGPFVADGITQTKVSIQLKTKKDVAVRDVVLALQISGTGNRSLPCSPSDENGKSECWIMSSVAEEKHVQTQGIVELKSKALFIAPKPMTTLFSFVASGDAQTLPSGHRIVAASGITQSDLVLKDDNNAVRMRASYMGMMLDWE